LIPEWLAGGAVWGAEPAHLGGIYSGNDAGLLRDVMRHRKPRVVVEIGARTGTLTALMASEMRSAELIAFERDEGYRGVILEKLSTVPHDTIKVDVLGNVITQGLEAIGEKPIDLLFIDANHDAILARWYIRNLFPLVRPGGLIHVHDVWSSGENDWDIACRRIAHEDIESHPRLRALYPTLVDLDGYRPEEIIGRHEGHELRDWVAANRHRIRTHSTFLGVDAYEKSDGDPRDYPFKQYPVDCAFWIEILS
jgi:predicted O-methyltransferase YrrM